MHSENKSRAQQAIQSEGKDQCKMVMRNGIETLDKMKCTDVAPRLKNSKVMHSKFVLKKTRSNNSEVRRYRGKFVVCGNEEDDIEEISLFLEPDLTAMKT